VWEAATDPFKAIEAILERLSEGTSVYRVIEGVSILTALVAVYIAILTAPIDPGPLYAVGGVVSIYGYNHLRKCRNLYQSYLWGLDELGHRPKGRGVYSAVIASIRGVEALLIACGALMIAYPLAPGILGEAYAWYALVAAVSSFGSVAVVGHFTRVRLYRAFAERVLRGG